MLLLERSNTWQRAEFSRHKRTVSHVVSVTAIPGVDLGWQTTQTEADLFTAKQHKGLRSCIGHWNHPLPTLLA